MSERLYVESTEFLAKRLEARAFAERRELTFFVANGQLIKLHGDLVDGRWPSGTRTSVREATVEEMVLWIKIGGPP